jgi:hypothetical protein
MPVTLVLTRSLLEEVMRPSLKEGGFYDNQK